MLHKSQGTVCAVRRFLPEHGTFLHLNCFLNKGISGSAISSGSAPEGSDAMQAAAQDDAFSALYRQHVNTVYHIALSYLKNPAEAEDVTSEVFVQLLESGMQFPDASQARAWLITVTRNRCKNHLRHWLRRGRASEEVMEQIPVESMEPELRQVMEAVYRLPERYRLPLMLFAVEGYSVRETAEILKLNESTVRTRIARAREIVRKETGVDEA